MSGFDHTAFKMDGGAKEAEAIIAFNETNVDVITLYNKPFHIYAECNVHVHGKTLHNYKVYISTDPHKRDRIEPPEDEPRLPRVYHEIVIRKVVQVVDSYFNR